MTNHCNWHHKLPQNHARTNEEMADHLLSHRHITEGGCWEWTGLLSKSGYGKIKWRTYGDLRVHRVAAALWMDTTITDTRRVLHHCDNRKCFNPNHLFLGTDKDNQVDCSRKGRHHNAKKTHCKHGHEFTPENTWKEKNGSRHCRTCHLQKELARYSRRREVEILEAGRVLSRSKQPRVKQI